MEIQKRGSLETKCINHIPRDTQKRKERMRAIEDMKNSVARLNIIFQKVK